MPHTGLYPAALRPYRKSPRSPVPFLFQKPLICVHLCVKSAPDCHRMSHAPHTKQIKMEQFETFFGPGFPGAVPSGRSSKALGVALTP